MMFTHAADGGLVGLIARHACLVSRDRGMRILGVCTAPHSSASVLLRKYSIIDKCSRESLLCIFFVRMMLMMMMMVMHMFNIHHTTRV